MRLGRRRHTAAARLISAAARGLWDSPHAQPRQGRPAGRSGSTRRSLRRGGSWLHHQHAVFRCGRHHTSSQRASDTQPFSVPRSGCRGWVVDERGWVIGPQLSEMRAPWYVVKVPPIVDVPRQWTMPTSAPHMLWAYPAVSRHITAYPPLQFRAHLPGASTHWLGWVKRLFGSFGRRLNDINGGVAVWRVNDRLKCAPQTCP
jgi:hypothetical protein